LHRANIRITQWIANKAGEEKKNHSRVTLHISHPINREHMIIFEVTSNIIVRNITLPILRKYSYLVHDGFKNEWVQKEWEQKANEIAKTKSDESHKHRVNRKYHFSCRSAARLAQ